MFRRQWTRIAISLAIGLLFLLNAGGWVEVRLIRQLENLAYDARVRLTMPGTVDPRIVIVDIDEKSLARLGRWPWPRDRLAEFVNILFDHYGIGVLGFDVIFAEPDESYSLSLLEELVAAAPDPDGALRTRLERIRPLFQRDELFAQSLAARPVILGYYFRPDDVPEGGDAPTPLFPVLAPEQVRINTASLVHAKSYGANIPELQESAVGAGFFDNPLVDEDGVYRRVPLLQEHRGGLYESLALATARAALGFPPVELVSSLPEGGDETDHGVEWVKIGEHRIPVDGQLAALVPYRGPQGSFPFVSAVDVLEKRADPAVFKDAIVLLGTTAPGMHEHRSTPVQNVYAGVEVHANLVSGILAQSIKHRPAYTLGLEFLTLLSITVLLSLLLPVATPLWATLGSAGVLGALVWINLYAWNALQMVWPLASPALLVIVLFAFHMSYGFFTATTTKRQLARLFGQYVPRELVEEMSRSPDSITVEGENREMTVLFSDVRGFTSISEGLPPTQLTRLMNELLTPMTRIIHGHRGTIDKYMGDAIMAFWGAPLPDPRHARHAVCAALDMVRQVQALHAGFQARGWPPLRMGIGINTGMMCVGNMGSEFRMAYTALGDAVNLGSRLEGLTKHYGVDVIVGEATRAAIPDMVFRELDIVRVKGKDRPVAIFEPLGPPEAVDEAVRAELREYEQALKLYRAQQWDDAERSFANLLMRFPDRLLYRLYQERIAHFRECPPEVDWDGVFTHQTK